jgi:transcription elongation factor GreB
VSKAFTKETDDDSDDDLAESPSPLPQGVKNYMTPQGAERLRAELRKLMQEDRPKIVEVVHWAAGNGDRSENGDYIYGKKRLREIDRRIRFLSKRLENAEIIDPKVQKGDRVFFGATVTVSSEEDGEKIYYIVGIDETDASQGKVSWISPIGKTLIKAKVGDTVTLRSPKGEVELEVLKVEYKEIE